MFFAEVSLSLLRLCRKMWLTDSGARAEHGHSSRDCTHSQCFICGAIDTDHEARNCPVALVCSACGSRGHFARVGHSPLFLWSGKIALTDRSRQFLAFTGLHHRTRRAGQLWSAMQPVRQLEPRSTRKTFFSLSPG